METLQAVYVNCFLMVTFIAFFIYNIGQLYTMNALDHKKSRKINFYVTYNCEDKGLAELCRVYLSHKLGSLLHNTLKTD